MKQSFSAALPLWGGVLMMAALLLCPAAAADGVREGLRLCGELLIPSLFPPMVVTALLLRGGAVNRWGRRLDPVTRRLWRLPGCSGAVFLLAVTGGYPIGARCIRHLLDRGALTPAQARRMVCFCFGAGPGFAVTAVGCRLFGSVPAGLLLWSSQIAAALLLSLPGRTIRISVQPSPPDRAVSEGPVLTGAIRDAADGMFALCAAVLAFGAVQAMLRYLAAGHLPAPVPDVLLEVTAGVSAARSLGSPALASFALGWGGLCVHAQVAASCPLPRRFFLFRLLHGGLAAGITALIFPLLPAAEGAVATSASPVGAATAVHTPFSLALLGMISVFLFLLPESREKKKKFAG